MKDNEDNSESFFMSQKYGDQSTHGAREMYNPILLIKWNNKSKQKQINKMYIHAHLMLTSQILNHNDGHPTE